MHGWIILDKPVGLGSTQAVAAVKRNVREAGFGKVKVGHGGTLDPLASGVLPIALGEATKLCGRMLESSKIYDFTITFGAETDTLDSEGVIVARSDHIPDYGDIEHVMHRFRGEIDQVPPSYSALKIDGVRAYDRARAGEMVQMQSRRVKIHEIEYRAESELADGTRWATLRVHVSKGTYIRSLARDIAYALGSVGYVTMLRRLQAGPFVIEQAISLDKLNAFGQGAPQEDIILPIEAGLVDIPALDLSPEQARAVQAGRVLTGIAMKDGLHWARGADLRPIALVENIDGQLRTVRGFNL